VLGIRSRVWSEVLSTKPRYRLVVRVWQGRDEKVEGKKELALVAWEIGRTAENLQG